MTSSSPRLDGTPSGLLNCDRCKPFHAARQNKTREASVPAEARRNTEEGGSSLAGGQTVMEAAAFLKAVGVWEDGGLRASSCTSQMEAQGSRRNLLRDV